MVRPGFIAVAVLILTLLPGCGHREQASEAPDSSAVKVVASIFPLADLLRQLGGDRVEVMILLPAGLSPHTYEPTVEQAVGVSRASLVVHVGGGLDDWAVTVARAQGVETVAVMDHLADWVLEYRPVQLGNSHGACGHDHRGRDHEGHDHGDRDPHVWMDPVLVREAVAPLLAGLLADLDPERREEYQESLSVLQESLRDLDLEMRAKVETFSRRRFISYHSAWQYLSQRYRLEEVASVETFPGREPSAGWLGELVNLAREKGIDIIFAEPQLSQKAATVIAGEIGGRVLLLDPLGGEDLAGRDTYQNLIRYNFKVLKEALK